MTIDDSIIINGADNHVTDNISGPQGGGVEYQRRMMTGSIQAIAPISFVSSEPFDIDQIYLVEGSSENRTVETETIQLSGTRSVSTVKFFSRLFRVTKQSGSALQGIVTVSADTSILGIMGVGALAATDTDFTISTTPIETTELINLLGNAQGRATVDSVYYEKIFIRNNTGATINELTVSEYQSDFDGSVHFAKDPSFNFNSTSRNRLTRPGAVSYYDMITDTPLVITNMPAGAVLGIWLRITIPAGMATILKSWKMKVEFDGSYRVFTILQPEGTGNGLSATLGVRGQHPLGGGNPLQFVELRDAKFVEQLFYEPDPKTFRDQFYYNTRLNKLFKKLQTKPHPVWKQVR